MLFDAKGNILSAGGTVSSVLDFGADNTGTQNTQDAIQAAIDACAVVYFPAGTYLVSSMVYIPSNRFLYFEPGAVLKRNSGTNCMLTGKGDSSITGYDGVHDVTVYGATFDVNGSQYTYSCTALSFCHGQRIRVEGCNFVNHTTGWHQMEYSGCIDSVIDKCHFDAAGNTTESVQIECPYNAAAWPWNNGAIDSTPSRYISVRNCTFEGGTVALGHHGGGSAQHIDIAGCTFRNFSGVVVQFYGGTDVRVHDCVFTDCTGDVLIRDGHTAYNNVLNGTFTP